MTKIMPSRLVYVEWWIGSMRNVQNNECQISTTGQKALVHTTGYHVLAHTVIIIINIIIIIIIIIKKLERYGFTGLPRDHASGRVLILWEILQFPFECSDCGTYSNLEWNLIPSLYSRITKIIFGELYVQSTLGCPDLIDFLLSSSITEIWEQVSLLDCPGIDHSLFYRSLLLCHIALYLRPTTNYISTQSLT